MLFKNGRKWKICQKAWERKSFIQLKSQTKDVGVGFKSIKELKADTVLEGPFMILNLNGSQHSIFKTSASQMKIASEMLEMDFDSDHFLRHAYWYFHGNHKIVKQFVTLTATIYHPLLRKQLVLATMNCKHEDSNNVAKLGQKFSKASRKINQTKNADG